MSKNRDHFKSKRHSRLVSQFIYYKVRKNHDFFKKIIQSDFFINIMIFSSLIEIKTPEVFLRVYILLRCERVETPMFVERVKYDWVEILKPILDEFIFYSQAHSI